MRTECQRCKKAGFVRLENVIKAGETQRHYYCGACDHSWAVTDDGRAVKKGTRAAERLRRQ